MMHTVQFRILQKSRNKCTNDSWPIMVSVGAIVRNDRYDIKTLQKIL